MNTIVVDLSIVNPQQNNEIVIAQLADFPFYAFQENESGLEAFINDVDFSPIKNEISELIKQFSFINKFEVNQIEQQNWNSVWEASFTPVIVEDRLAIIAPFHDESYRKELTIEILPKMSFGTGHHQTTFLMTKNMLEMHNFPKTVLDMGTGTGVLAILAEQLGAKEIVAIDIEPWSAENTIENAERNKCKNIKTFCGDIDLLNEDKFDLILANINKNVLKNHMQSYVNHLNENGIIMLSGFFETDADEMIACCQQYGLTFQQKNIKETWCQLRFKK